MWASAQQRRNSNLNSKGLNPVLHWGSDSAQLSLISADNYAQLSPLNAGFSSGRGVEAPDEDPMIGLFGVTLELYQETA